MRLRKLLLFSSGRNLVLGDAECELSKKCEIRIRLPMQFPLEKDIIYTLQTMKELVDKYIFHDNHDYVELLNAACVRITLLNACRGSEPAPMLLSNWKHGETMCGLIDHQLLSDLESMLVKQMKIGKGKNHLVPVLIFHTVATTPLLVPSAMCHVSG